MLEPNERKFRMKSRKSALLSTASVRTLTIAGAALASLTLLGACEGGGSYRSANPCSAFGVTANPCNPCAAAANPCNPCAAAANPCGPSAAYNPCAAQTVAQGTFYDGPHAPGHRVSGEASITKGADGAYWLRFAGFVSDQGPDVNVILSPVHVPKTDAAVKAAGYITVAPRSALTGDQSYRLPDDFDPKDYRSVGIWCEQFGVLFGAAQTQTPNSRRNL